MFIITTTTTTTTTTTIIIIIIIIINIFIMLVYYTYLGPGGLSALSARQGSIGPADCIHYT